MNDLKAKVWRRIKRKKGYEVDWSRTVLKALDRRVVPVIPLMPRTGKMQLKVAKEKILLYFGDIATYT